MKPAVESRRTSAAIARLTQARACLANIATLLAREESPVNVLAALADVHARVADAERVLAKERFVELERQYRKEPRSVSERERRELAAFATIL